METLLNIAIVIFSFLGMEFVAWFTHKYIMHGFLWVWHKSHHDPKHKGIFERNDLFALVFSLPAVATIMAGLRWQQVSFLLYVGIGITLYGVCYFVFHDLIVHRRIKFSFRVNKKSYLWRIMKAHYIHHRRHTKEGCESFGFLYTHPKYNE